MCLPRHQQFRDVEEQGYQRAVSVLCDGGRAQRQHLIWFDAEVSVLPLHTRHLDAMQVLAHEWSDEVQE
jgi:hypothetical protein